MQTRKWRWLGASPAALYDHYSVGPDGKQYLKLAEADLVPGKVFEAPADWEPRHYEYENVIDENGFPKLDEKTGAPLVTMTRVPHPLFEEVVDKPVVTPPTAAAPQAAVKE